MFTRITLDGAPSFAAGTGGSLEELDRFNFVFGPNGTGKTTISRIIVEPRLHDGTAYETSNPALTTDAAVYNRDYADRTLREASRLSGVFVLDDEDPEAREEFHKLTSESGSIASRTTIIQDLKDKIGAIDRQLAKARSELVELAWSERANVPTELKPMFEGYNGKKEVFAEKLIGVVRAEVPTTQELMVEAKAAFESAGSPAQPLSKPPGYESVASHPAWNLLAAPITGSADVTLAALINDLGNQDWVAKGRDFLAVAEDRCPFCQQGLPDNFLEHLAEFYDATYAQAMESIASLATAATEVHALIGRALDALDRVAPVFVDGSRRDTLIAGLRTSMRRNEDALTAKLASPTALTTVSDLGPQLQEVGSLIDQVNLRVTEHNARLANRSTARAALVERCWTFFAWGTLGSNLGRYHGVVAGTKDRLAQLTTELNAAREDQDKDQQRAKDLESSLVSSAPAIARINRLLKAVGFERFHLAPSDELKDGYRLQRPDGKDVENTLSDGERSFIAFLYYFVQLEAKHRSSDLEPLVAVIDDPISSLDSDVLFVVGSLVRRIIQMINAEDGRLRQLILLTHNIQFYLEVTYPRSADKRTGALRGRRYYELRRGSDGLTRVSASTQNEVRSNYQRLWEAVRRATDDGGPTDAGLENVLRRILENYFTLIGSFPDLDEVMESAGGDEVIASKALLAWLHHGSHSLVDDFNYSPSGISRAVYLKVFRDIFERTNQLGHYELMMAQG
ncbi:AAA family ATPase [Salinibacterium sp. ZJ70]|uniref:AAA family ATPase n=1 Tax=Salinibacterium sp. ZJ70 TaxID=2708084 RepID=UPI001422E1A3|nr:AAA family ATPase [Salinibacterium sp. ZJ70]